MEKILLRTVGVEKRLIYFAFVMTFINFADFFNFNLFK